jgi:hypothetical protein
VGRFVIGVDAHVVSMDCRVVSMNPRGNWADVVATVMVLQSLEGLSDRDAARQLRTNIAWKVATGMALDDPGFHATVLTLWRNRLRASARPQRIFDAVRAVVDQTGILATRHRRVLDSTVLDDAVTKQETSVTVVAIMGDRARRHDDPVPRAGRVATVPARDVERRA